jgi:hypothetical protein
MPTNQIDLAQLFGQVAQSLAQNKSALNEADSYNKNHGDNMAEIFRLITQAVEQKKGAKPATQLKYAAAQVKKIPSGSAQVYAQGLAQAAKDLKGKSVNTANILQLVQDLVSGGQKKPAQSTPLADVLGALVGSQSAGVADDKLDAGDLLTAGLAFLAAKQSGDDNVNAAIKALLAESPLSASPHREQSGELVMNTLLKAIGSMAQRG